MENLRRLMLDNGKYQIPLTMEESARGGWYISNPTWLAEHRPQPWTHPEARDIPIGLTRLYHLYSNPEDYKNSEFHWKTQKMIYTNNYFDVWYHHFEGYNPTFDILDKAIPTYIHMYLPIYQRYLTCRIEVIIGEIFNNLRPQYLKI